MLEKKKKKSDIAKLTLIFLINFSHCNKFMFLLIKGRIPIPLTKNPGLNYIDCVLFNLNYNLLAKCRNN